MIPQSQIDEALQYVMNITDPNMNSGNFEPINRRFKSGTALEQHLRLVEAGLKKMKSGTVFANDVVTLSAKGNALITAVRQHAHDIVAASEAIDGSHVNREALSTTLQSLLITGLREFSDEERHLLFATFLAQAVAADYR